MKKLISLVLSLSLIAFISFTATGAATENLKPQQNAARLTDTAIQQMYGTGPTSKFFDGVACGAGIVAIAAGTLSGVGALGAFLIVTGTVASCANAFDS
ncbi:MAG: hypothetical protein L0226_06880 [Acidobacteria bacterium]|nr:hypothetical protein [Acidobacteriota bacterium]